MSVARSLVKLGFGAVCVLGGVTFAPLLTGGGVILATALGNVAAGNTANAIDALTAGEEGDRVSLENEDLTKAVGKAIAVVITLAAKKYRDDARKKLEKIAAQAKNNWVTIARRELTQQLYPELKEGRLDRFLTPEELQFSKTGNLTEEEWGNIFVRLNMAACQGGGFSLPSEVRDRVAELLHSTFPQALRETLKEDFVKDGKAFAGLTLQLLAGMKAEIEQLRGSRGGESAGEVSQILERFQQLETQLQGTTVQQQAFFTQIAGQIDSGFSEVCEDETISGKFLILGKPRSGKTTTLLELTRELIERAEIDADEPIPVILELSEWRKVKKGWFGNKEEYDPSIKEWILSQLQRRGISQKLGEQWLGDKELAFLLDGLDELPSERQEKCVKAINQFLASEFAPLYLYQFHVKLHLIKRNRNTQANQGETRNGRGSIF